MSIVSPGISHAFQYAVPPLHGIKMRLFHRFIREGVLSQAGVDLVDFKYAQTIGYLCHVILALS